MKTALIAILVIAFVVLIGTSVVCAVLALLRVRRVPLSAPASTERAAQREYDRTERAHMPHELRRARLLVSEETLKCDDPHPLSARLDQLFLLADDSLLLVETKTRQGAYVTPYDVLELSVQQQVIRRGGDPRFAGRKLNQYAYVRVASDGQPPRYVAVELVDEKTVLAYFKRWHFLTHRKVPDEQMPLRGAYHPRECRNCEFAASCRLQPA